MKDFFLSLKNRVPQKFFIGIAAGTVITLSGLTCLQAGAVTYSDIQPGIVWLDEDGVQINAHGSCVFWHEDAYYWFGETRTGSKSDGVSLYRSTDLYNWKNLGVVFRTEQSFDPETGSALLERPKVIYNEKTGKFVMYSHWEDGTGYGRACVCVAVADKIDGPYELSGVFRPNEHDSRDQTLFKDTDGKAYHFGSTRMNRDMNVALLTEDYLTTETNPVTETQILLDQQCEAPAIIKVADTYLGLFSGCTGWDPNAGRTATSFEILGDWKRGDNFAIGENSHLTHYSQSAWLLEVPGYDRAYIYVGDRWIPSNVGGSTQIWLPVSLRSGKPVMKWYDSWDLSWFEANNHFSRVLPVREGVPYKLIDPYSDRFLGVNDEERPMITDSSEYSFVFEKAGDDYTYKMKADGTDKYMIMDGRKIVMGDGTVPEAVWKLIVNEDGTYTFQNAATNRWARISSEKIDEGTRLEASAMQSDHGRFGLYLDNNLETPEAVKEEDFADPFARGFAERCAGLYNEYREYVAGVETVTFSGALELNRMGDVVNVLAPEAGVLTLADCTGRVVWSGEVAEGVTTVPAFFNGVGVAVLRTSRGVLSAKFLM